MLYVRCLLFFQNYYLSSVDLHRILSNLGAVNTGGPSGVDLEKKMVKEENLQLPALAEDVIECHGGEESDGLARGD